MKAFEDLQGLTEVEQAIRVKTGVNEGRLNSWKEIADYVGYSVRTCQEWEREKSLPVHRVNPKSPRSPVYAHTWEIDAWIERGRKPPQEEQTSPKRRLLWSVVAFLTCIILVVLWFPNFPSRGDRTPRLLPFTSYRGLEGGPKYSPDGKTIAFQWTNNGSWDIYVKEFDSDIPRLVVGGPAWEVFPIWSKDGKTLTFIRDYVDDKDRPSAIFRIPVSGGPEEQLVQLNSLGWDWSISYSPDDRFLAFSDCLEDNPAPHILLLDMQTGDIQTVTSPEEGQTGDVSPVFSPNGRKIAFSRQAGSGVADVWVYDLASGESRAVTDANFDTIAGLTWSKNGQEIIFSAARETHPLLWRVGLNGGEPEQLSVSGAILYAPTVSPDGSQIAFQWCVAEGIDIWESAFPPKGDSAGGEARIVSTRLDVDADVSPDGEEILFVSDRSGQVNIWKSRADGTQPEQLTRFERPAQSPRWSPDGSLVVFDAREDGDSEIAMMNPDGSGLHWLTQNSSEDLRPSWSGDGKWIYFVSDRSGRYEIWRIPTDGGSAVQITSEGAGYGMESSDGRYLYYSRCRESEGLWKVPISGGESVQLLEGHTICQGWDLTDELLLFVEKEGLRVYDLKSEELTEYELSGRGPYWGVTLSPDEKSIYFGAYPKNAGADIQILEGF